jgi:hypothetical protein
MADLSETKGKRDRQGYCHAEQIAGAAVHAVGQVKRSTVAGECWPLYLVLATQLRLCPAPQARQTGALA